MQFWINVIVLASMYALLAAGYVLIYRASRVINLAHGELMMLAAYVLFALARAVPGGPWLLIPLTLLVAAVLGLLLYYLLVRPMAGRPFEAPILLTVALGIVVQGIVVLVWTPRAQYPASALGIAAESYPLPIGGVISS